MLGNDFKVEHKSVPVIARADTDRECDVRANSIDESSPRGNFGT